MQKNQENLVEALVMGAASVLLAAAISTALIAYSQAGDLSKQLDSRLERQHQYFRDNVDKRTNRCFLETQAEERKLQDNTNLYATWFREKGNSIRTRSNKVLARCRQLQKRTDHFAMP